MKHVRNLLLLLASAVLVGNVAFADSHKEAECGMDSGGNSQHMKQMATDAWLDGKLESALLFNGQLNSFRIDTEVKNETAYLTGSVESDIDRELAGEVAKSIDGIEKIENRLTVDAKAAEDAKKSESWMEQDEWRRMVNNATLTAAVKTQLLLNEHTDGLDINVDSMNGVVTLSGTVESEEESALAEQIAGNTENSRDVNNRLTVQSDKG